MGEFGLVVLPLVGFEERDDFTKYPGEVPGVDIADSEWLTIAGVVDLLQTTPEQAEGDDGTREEAPADTAEHQPLSASGDSFRRE